MSGEGSVSRFAPVPDTMIAVEPNGELCASYDAGREHSDGPARKIGQLPVCWDPDADAAARRAHEQFR